ncbi:hypothetical protein N9374_03280 [Candidatus Pelagibacter sp.]|nr:hypothetical protein [Candidatus Pelagibacter sp.]
MIKIPKKPSNKELINFFRKKKLTNILNKSKKNILTVNQLKSKEPYKPELLDLYIIFQLIKTNKRISCLEYGSGWSSLLIALALNENEKQYKKEVSNLRRNYRFKNLIIDNEKKYLSITKKRIEQVDRNLLKHSDFIFSKCRVKFINYNYVTEFDYIPKINPDFIYLDGPDQFNIIKSNDGFNIDSKDLTPMAADILKIEFFLNPGTIVLVDGRGANANYLKINLARNWRYKYLQEFDQHIFVLDEKPYGVESKKILKFFRKK